MELNNLIIEVTRRCNIKCEHCLRGNAQRIDMSEDYIYSLLSQIEGIGTVTFSGGEPSLNVPILEYFLKMCQQFKISIGSFYIATNGVKISTEFVMFCLKMYSCCEYKDECRVDLSNDTFHLSESDQNIELLSGLSFFGKKFENDGYNYMYRGGSNLLNEGRAKDLFCSNNKPTKVDKFDCKYDFQESDIYLNCKGEIVNGCDWSYTSQKKNVICKVEDIKKFYENLPED